MIQSMTTFSRVSDQGDWGGATWEVKVVNHRYFDCSLRMPDIFRCLEADIKSKLQKKLSRGRVECHLRFDNPVQSESGFVLNTALVEKIVKVVNEVKSYVPMSTVDPMKILSWPNVLSASEVDTTLAQEKISQLFEKVLDELVATREREGSGLSDIMKEKTNEILTIVAKVKVKAPEILEEQRQKIIKRLEDAQVNLDQTRLEQEMVYMAQKSDATEELDRLEIHAKEVLRILDTSGVVGKRLDFLMQEFGREANTLASKSNDIEITQSSVDLKVLIEQMREQVQNIV